MGAVRGQERIQRARGDGVNAHCIPVHTPPGYLERGFVAGIFPEADRNYPEALSLPMCPDLSCDDQEWAVRCLEEALRS